MDFVDVDVGDGGALAYDPRTRPVDPHADYPKGQREVRRTLRAGFGGSTGRVSRERSSRIGAVLAQEAVGTLLRS